VLRFVNAFIFKRIFFIITVNYIPKSLEIYWTSLTIFSTSWGLPRPLTGASPLDPQGKFRPQTLCPNTQNGSTPMTRILSKPIRTHDLTLVLVIGLRSVLELIRLSTYDLGIGLGLGLRLGQVIGSLLYRLVRLPVSMVRDDWGTTWLFTDICSLAYLTISRQIYFNNVSTYMTFRSYLRECSSLYIYGIK